MEKSSKEKRMAADPEKMALDDDALEEVNGGSFLWNSLCSLFGCEQEEDTRGIPTEENPEVHILYMGGSENAKHY